MATNMTPTELAELFNSISQYIDANMTAIISTATLFEYAGFDVFKFVTNLRLKESDKIVFQSDVVKMITLFLSRGNAVTNMVKKMGDEGKMEVHALVEKYDIKPKVANSDDPNVVTLARVATSFTHLTAVLLDKLQVRLPFDIKSECDACPRSISLSSIFSIIPRPGGMYRQETVEEIIGAALYCQYRQYKIINAKNKNRLTNDLEIGQHITTYAVISFKSTIYSDDRRKALSVKYGYFSKVSATIVPAAWAKKFYEDLCAIFETKIIENFF